MTAEGGLGRDSEHVITLCGERFWLFQCERHPWRIRWIPEEATGYCSVCWPHGWMRWSDGTAQFARLELTA